MQVPRPSLVSETSTQSIPPGQATIRSRKSRREDAGEYLIEIIKGPVDEPLSILWLFPSAVCLASPAIFLAD